MSLPERVLDAAAGLFARAGRAFGGLFLRVLSTCVLVFGVVGAVLLDMAAFYYRGVLDAGPLVACLLYMPALAALAVIREETLRVGPSRAGVGAARASRPATVAYLALLIAAAASLAHPLWLRGRHSLSVRSLWTAWTATGLFYYSLLVSEVLFAAALGGARGSSRGHGTGRGDGGGYGNGGGASSGSGSNAGDCGGHRGGDSGACPGAGSGDGDGGAGLGAYGAIGAGRKSEGAERSVYDDAAVPPPPPGPAVTIETYY
jgi:hypothetical protein